MGTAKRLSSDEDIREFALQLLSTDTEKQVIDALRSYGYWDEPMVWRQFGDTDNNYSAIGNQQSRPEAALVEKLVNCIDARLLNECLVRGINPESEAAPQSIRAAVATFFEDATEPGPDAGQVSNWPEDRQREQARHITVALTGLRPRQGRPCITVADLGEGQTPARVPETFLSLDRKNKQRVPFVQGKFNMGGTGALKFCGAESLQLLITRRNPALIKDGSAEDLRWSITVVRRERPAPGSGNLRNSVYKYLAPVDATARPYSGALLSFRAEQLPMMPEKNDAYARMMRWGSVIKLYEYELKGKSHALMPDGLLGSMELLLPGAALPIRVHECRDFRGEKQRSFENTLVGLNARLESNRGMNLENGYPSSVPFTVSGERMVARIYAFLPGKADSYRSNEGIVFVVNGQTHGSIPKTFYERKSVKMKRLASSLLVVVECSELSVGAREDLFMNSRDRLSNGELRRSVERQLEDVISHHPGLRALQEARKNQELQQELSEAKPLEEVLEQILKRSPSLAKLFLLGQRVGNPFRGKEEGEGGGVGGKQQAHKFTGKPHPTFFRFAKKKDGEELTRTAELGRKCRIKFETDVENDYFSRASTPGRYHIEVVAGALDGAELDSNITLHDGMANWSISSSVEQLAAGDEMVVQCTVTDDSLVEPFVNVAKVRFIPAADREPGVERESRSKPSGDDGAGAGMGDGAGGGGRSDGGSIPIGLKLPHPIRVRKGDPKWTELKFDDFSACTFVEDHVEGFPDRSEFTFYVNVDNRYLLTDLKERGEAGALHEARFVYGNVLLALALIHQNRNSGKGAEEDEETSLSDQVALMTRAVAPFLIPMIDGLGGLTDDDVNSLAAQGDEE